MLLDVMAAEQLSPHEKVVQLRSELGEHHKTGCFAHCETMGQLVRAHIELLIDGLG
jgi:hypothetical protein